MPASRAFLRAVGHKLPAVTALKGARGVDKHLPERMISNLLVAAMTRPPLVACGAFVADDVEGSVIVDAAAVTVNEMATHYRRPR